MVDIKVERWDSVNTYADIAMIAAITYFWYNAYISLMTDNDDLVQRLVSTIDDKICYNLDISDITFVCLWPILRIILKVTRRVYFVNSYVEVQNMFPTEGGKEKKFTILGLLFGWQLGPPSNSMYETTPVVKRNDFSIKRERIIDDEDEASTMINQLMANYELALIRFFCTEETFLRFRRNYRDWGTIESNNMTLHKAMICIILAVAVSIVVDFLEGPHYVLEILTAEDCKLKSGRCLDGDEHILGISCWCAVNVIANIPVFLAVIAGTVIGVIAAMRAVMVMIFSVWLQQKSVLSTWCVTANNRRREAFCDGWNYEIVLPESASVAKAFFGYPTEGWMKKIKEMKEHKNFLTMNEIDVIFSKEHLFEVTHDIKYYLIQGTTSFQVTSGVHVTSGDLTLPILLVKGEWRGGQCSPRTKANRRDRHDAMQIINVSYSKDHRHLIWERKQGKSELLLTENKLEDDDSNTESKVEVIVQTWKNPEYPL